jgi:hypothetical protein
LNVGRRGSSISAGIHGAHVTVAPHRPARITVGAPGTGLSATETFGRQGAARRRPLHRRPHAHVVLWTVAFVVMAHLLWGWF